jgi:hypothetical protein
MKSRLVTLAVFVHVVVPAMAQVSLDWASRYSNAPGVTEVLNAMALDSSGAIYFAGYTDGANQANDVLTVKLNQSGDTIWTRRYDGPVGSYDQANGIAVDKRGYVYVTGSTSIRHKPGDFPNKDMLLIRYTPGGDTSWVRTSNGLGDNHDEGREIVLDDSGFVYVAGNVSATETDFAVMKYDTTGKGIWSFIWNNGRDAVNDIAVDRQGNVYLTGMTLVFPGPVDSIVTIKISASGEKQWVRTYPGMQNTAEGARSMCLDTVGNVYVTGVTHNGPPTYDDFITLKYSSTGDLIWAKTFNGPGSYIDIGSTIAFDGLGSVYVAGMSYHGTVYGTQDYALVKYQAGNGDTVWARRYDGVYDHESPVAMVIDDAQGIYLTGRSGYDVATVKFNTAGETQWSVRYTGGNYGQNYGMSIALDKSRKVYVGGFGVANVTGIDAFVLKYSQQLSSGVEGEVAMADVFALSANFPNPFNPTTVIKYRVPVASSVRLAVYDLLGREVAVLANEEKAAGSYSAEFNALGIASGTYIFRMMAGGHVLTQKALLLR